MPDPITVATDLWKGCGLVPWLGLGQGELRVSLSGNFSLPLTPGVLRTKAGVPGAQHFPKLTHQIAGFFKVQCVDGTSKLQDQLDSDLCNRAHDNLASQRKGNIHLAHSMKPHVIDHPGHKPRGPKQDAQGGTLWVQI